MIPKDVRLYTWVDVEEVLLLAHRQNDWPEGLVWARPYWDSLTLGISPGKQQLVLEWLAEKFDPRFEETSESKYILLVESVRGVPRKLEVLFEETDEVPSHSRLTPRLAKPAVLWPPYEAEHPSPLPSNLPPVVAFHSFKGGVGRTFHAIALARAIVKRSRNKSRVLLVDADLEAPGLTWLLRTRFPSPPISFEDFLALVHSDPDATASTSIELVADQVREIYLDGVYVLPAFRSDRQFASLEVKPEHLIQGAKDPFILTALLAKLGKLLNVRAVIVDLRAGLSELSTGLLLDPRAYRVLVTTLGGQSIEGTCYLLQLLAELAPPKHEQEPLPALIISQVPLEYQKRSLFLAPYERRLLEAANSLLGNQQEDGLPDLLYLVSSFDSNLLILPNEWSEVTKQLNQSALVEQLYPLADWLPDTSLDNAGHGQDFAKPQSSRKQLAEFAEKLIYAETGDISDFLTISPLRNLASDYRVKVPIAVIVGAKGSGKTYTFLQVVRRATWQKFISDAGVPGASRETPVYVYPVLQSRNLQQTANSIVKSTQQQTVKALGLAGPFDLQQISDYLKDGLTRDFHEGQWRERWLDVIAWRAGFDVGKDGAGRRFTDYLRGKGQSVVAVIDGLEDLFQDLSSEKSQQTALRSLLQDVPGWLEQQPSRLIGLVIFVRQDMVSNAVKQNPAQLIAKYEPYALKWRSEEALRLVAWISQQAKALSETGDLQVMDMPDLIDALVPLWGRKLGGEDSREARSVEWVIAALSDLKGQIQARDLVQFLHLAAHDSERNLRWLDRLLVPAAIRGAVKVCGKEKIKEIRIENPVLGNILSKLEQLPNEGRQNPFVRELVNLSSEEMKVLEDNGVVLREAEEYYMSEIFRQGLNFRYKAGARPSVIMLSRRARKWS